MARKKVEEPRRNWTVRLSDEEREQVDRNAARAGRKPSDYARDRLLGAPGSQALIVTMPTEKHRLAAVALSKELRTVGVNLNQLVRRANTYPDDRLPADTPLLLAQIRELVRQARDL